MSKYREVNYSELDCRLEGYLNKYESIINTSKEMEDMVDDILKLVNECSYPSGKVGQLQTQLEKAEKVIEFYAKKSSWLSDIGERKFLEIDAIDYQSLEYRQYDMAVYGGKTAREYLKDKEAGE